jgi:hypothetical protein
LKGVEVLFHWMFLGLPPPRIARMPFPLDRHPGVPGKALVIHP